MSAFKTVLEDLRGECMYEATNQYNDKQTQHAWMLVFIGAVEEYYRKGMIGLTEAKEMLRTFKKEVTRW